MRNVRYYEFYLFDDLPLIIEDIDGEESEIYPDYIDKFSEVSHTAFNDYFLAARDHFEGEDCCVVVARWNTGNWAVVGIEGPYIKVKN